jgi:putative tricarboxylic transport membrane protein
VLTFSAMTRLGGKSPMKSVVSIFFGFILAAVGMDIVSGQLRMTFDLVPLMGGFNFIVAVIGLFGLGEIFLTVEEGLKMEGVAAKVTLKDILDGLKELAVHGKVLVMSSLIGCWLGIQPGGATPASFMAYGFAKGSASDKDQYGKGASSGIIAPEAAAHGAGTAATLPMITLGIPGSPTMAVIMGGLLIMGLQPGPMLFKEHPDFVWGLIGSIWVANFLGLIIVMAFAPLFAAILRIKFSVLMPIIIYVCAIGAFAVNNRMIDICYMLIFGVIGYLFKKLDYPIDDGAGPGPRQHGGVGPETIPDHEPRKSVDLFQTADRSAPDAHLHSPLRLAEHLLLEKEKRSEKEGDGNLKEDRPFEAGTSFGCGIENLI